MSGVSFAPRRATLAHPREHADRHRAIEELDRRRIGHDVERAVSKREGPGARRPNPVRNPGDVDVGDEAVGGLDPVAA
jgi:hypothetical protein